MAAVVRLVADQVVGRLEQRAREDASAFRSPGSAQDVDMDDDEEETDDSLDDASSGDMDSDN